MHIVVIGAGVIGVTTAYYLVADGHEVSVIEARDAAGQETSFANGGQICPSESAPWAGPSVVPLFLRGLLQVHGPIRWHPSADLDQWRWLAAFLARCNINAQQYGLARNLILTTYSLETLRSLRRQLDTEAQGVALEYDAKTKGILRLFRDEASLSHAQGLLPYINEAGVAARVIDPEEALEIEPALKQAIAESAVRGVIYSPTDESGDAHLFTQALRKIAEEKGAQFRFGVQAEGFETAGGRITSIQTNQGLVAFDAVVVAAGVGSARLAHQLGMRLPIYPLKGYSVTIPLDEPEDAPNVSLSDEGRKIVMSRLGGRLRAAGMADLVGYDSSVNPRRAKAIGEQVLELFPGCGGLDAAEFWAGLRPMTPDGSPVLGRVSQWENLYFNSGHGSLGWTMACGSGRVIADLVAERSPEIPADEFALARF